MKYRIVDTTLRDGEQTPGMALSLEKKCHLARQIDDLNIYQIEAGIPAMEGEEKEAIKKISSMKLNAKISAWNRMCIQDIKHSIDCKPDIIHISVPISDIQLKHKLKKDIHWVYQNMLECVQFSLGKGFETTIGFEDASRADINTIIEFTRAIMALGVTRIRYADTVGILTPKSAYSVIRQIRVKTLSDIEIHTHNDFGMAVANSRAAVLGGAQYVNTTLYGIGERSGNCDFSGFNEAMCFFANANHSLGS